MTPCELCRVARGRWGAGATFAQQIGKSDATGTRQSRGVNRPGRVRNELFPVFPVRSDLFPVKTGTLFFNGDKGMRHFPGLVPGVPTFFCRYPKADPRNPTPKRPATRCLGTGGHGPAGEWGGGGPPSGPSWVFQVRVVRERENSLVNVHRIR